MPYCVIEIDNSEDNGSYTVLANDGDVELTPASPAQYIVTVGTLVRVAVLSGWAYLTGDGPVAKTNSGKMAASGSKGVIQLIPADTANDMPSISRFIFLSGTSASVALLDDSDSKTLSAGYFVDIFEDPNGAYMGDAGLFDPDYTAGSEGLIAAVNTARTAKSID